MLPVYTPEPWYILPTAADHGETTTITAGGLAIATIHSAAWDSAATLKYPEDRANARLIAQAPTLCELVQRALPMLMQLDDYIGNGPIDPARDGSNGARCDLIGDIKDALDAIDLLKG